MDKLLLIASLIFIVPFVNTAPTSKLLSSLQSNDEENEMPSPRQHKMMGYFNPYYVNPFYVATFYPPEFYDDFSAYYGYGDEDEIMSRTAGNRKRPGSFKNSPIYYIRLPPVPYMFIPGLGYVSNPPSYAPMPERQPASIFYNLPLDFISNGKPSNILSWGSPAFGSNFAASPAVAPQFNPAPPQFTPTYQRPSRPYQRPMNPFIQESKVTNLKGQYLFNGRPDGEIYVLNPNAYGSIYPDPRFVAPFGASSSFY